MTNQQTQSYLRTRVFTATPEQLQLMLYDGAIRYGEQARIALEKKDFEQSFDLLSRAQKIIAELTACLKHDVSPQLCGKLASLYNFVYRKLIEANVEHTLKPLDEALDILRYQRQTWQLLLDQLGKTKAAAAASKLDLPQPNERMEASISMQG
ncbi:MAG TPA: flagellar export chaperone FliS [Tepidisphaeraceae bacterium]|nr:flagellar export chaperone FliS [Tepidisphaeraceae bacterium]